LRKQNLVILMTPVCLNKSQILDPSQFLRPSQFTLLDMARRRELSSLGQDRYLGPCNGDRTKFESYLR